MQQPDILSRFDSIPQALVDSILDGTRSLADVYGLTANELDAMYIKGYNLYNQARWSAALVVFDVLAYYDHLESRYHIARAACLKMLSRHEDALKAYGVAHILDIEDPEVAMNIVECLIALHRKADALVALKAVDELTEGNSQHTQTRARAEALAALIQNEGTL